MCTRWRDSSRTEQEVAISKAGGEASPEASPADTLALDFHPIEPLQNKILLFKPLALYYNEVEDVKVTGWPLGAWVKRDLWTEHQPEAAGRIWLFLLPASQFPVLSETQMCLAENCQ